MECDDLHGHDAVGASLCRLGVVPTKPTIESPDGGIAKRTLVICPLCVVGPSSELPELLIFANSRIAPATEVKRRTPALPTGKAQTDCVQSDA